MQDFEVLLAAEGDELAKARVQAREDLAAQQTAAAKKERKDKTSGLKAIEQRDTQSAD